MDTITYVNTQWCTLTNSDVTKQTHGHSLNVSMVNRQEFAYRQMDIYTNKVNADKMLHVIVACNQRMIIKAIRMGSGLFLRRLYGTTHDTKDVSKTTDTQYSAAVLYPTNYYGLGSQHVFY